MSTDIVSTLYTDYVKPFQTHLVTLFVILIFVMATLLAYKWYIKPTVENLNAADISNDNQRESEVQLYLFSADWCPHCKRAKPEWDEFSKNYSNKKVGNYNVTPIAVDCSEGDDPLIQKYSVDGYPTVLMIKDGQRVNYDAKITFDNLSKFVNDVLQ